MSRDGGCRGTDGYPPEYREFVKHAQTSGTRLKRSALLSGGTAVFLAWGCFHDWAPMLLFDLAPFAILVFLLLLLCLPGTAASTRVASVLPYFHKSHPGVSGGCSFLSGKALARNCVFLDALALELGLEPVSTFGFADDLNLVWGGARVVWHEPERGLNTVSGLRTALHRNPSLLADAEAVIAELGLIEANLEDAVRLQAPFCLLLRYGSFASGHEMEVRQGYFCYSEPATLSPEGS